MTEVELLTVQLKMAQALATSRARMNDFLTEVSDIQQEILELYRAHVPDGFELPKALSDRIEALRPAA